MAPVGPARALPVRRHEATPSPAPASGVYLRPESAGSWSAPFGPAPPRAREGGTPSASPPVAPPRPAARRLPSAPTARSLGVRPIVPRAPLIEVEELEGRDAAYVALLELAIADDEWAEDELTQAYAPSRAKRRAGSEAPPGRLDEMLDELAAVAVSEEWDDDPVTNRYALPLPTRQAMRAPDGTHALDAARAASQAPTPAPSAARRASAWAPASALARAWRAWR